MEYNLDLIYGINEHALAEKQTFPDGNCTRIQCCELLKTEALKNTLNGTGPRYRLNHATGKYEREQDVYKRQINGRISADFVMLKSIMFRR